MRPDWITGKQSMDQLQKGDNGQMEGSIANALFEEWTVQQQYNTTDKAILPVECKRMKSNLTKTLASFQ